LRFPWLARNRRTPHDRPILAAHPDGHHAPPQLAARSSIPPATENRWPKPTCTPDYIIYVKEALKTFFAATGRIAYVSGNNFLYWQEGDPKKCVSPDGYVVSTSLSARATRTLPGRRTDACPPSF
jgi:hypothetical protein